MLAFSNPISCTIKQYFMALFVLIFTSFSTNPSFATERVAAKSWHSDWVVFVDTNPKTCWAASQPKTVLNTKNGKSVAVKRGDILLFVSFIPTQNVTAQISFSPGYPLKEAKIISNNKSYNLLVNGGNWAWAFTSKDDANIVRDIMSGSKLIVKSKSNRGILTEDTFSLKGSRAAVEEAARRCNADIAYLNKKTNQQDKKEDQVIVEAPKVTCENDVTICSVDELCRAAVTYATGSPQWSTTKKNEKYVNYAKKNGVTCGVKVAQKNNELTRVASGTGFFVNTEGHIVTNSHVISGCNEMRDGLNKLKIIADDPRNDLAILKASRNPTTFFKLSTKKPEILEPIIAAGYPFGDTLSSSIKVTKGIVSSLVGLDNNASEMQIDAALQPGNSGGPIINENGNVVAVAVAKLDAGFALENFGVLPENTNFGVKVSTLKSLLDARSVNYKIGNDESTVKLSQLVTNGTVFLTCWMTADRIKKMEKNKVMFKSVEN